MQTKIYQLRKRYAAYFETKYCGVKVPMRFSLGACCDPDMRAELVATDKFIQDAIEADPRFGKLYFLAQTYGEPDVVEAPEPAEEKPKKKGAAKVKKEDAKVFKNINDALYYLEEELGVDISTDDTEALLKKYNVVIEG